MASGPSADPVTGGNDEPGGTTEQGRSDERSRDLGIVVGLVVIALMAVAPLLVDLDERFPAREHDENGAAHAERNRRPLELRWSDKKAA